MSYRINPFMYNSDLTGKKDQGIFIPQETQFIIFSGYVRWPDLGQSRVLGKRFSDDKI